MPKSFSAREDFFTTVRGAGMRQVRNMKIALIGVYFFVLNVAFGYFQSRLP